MTILLVGGGGREHALAWRLALDFPGASLVAAPGNPGIAQLARCVPVKADDVAGLVALARAEGAAFVVVGPEAPLAAGLVDQLRAVGIPAFGPTQAAAQLETSKAFAKQVMREAGVPTATATRHTDAASARAAARALGAPVVIKASGLAAGKGVIIAQTMAEADAAIEAMLVGGQFGAAGAEILVEAFMSGEELSLFLLTDGTHALPLPAAQDHKRVGVGDTGPNTGGMGAYAPVTIATPEIVRAAIDHIAEPLLAAMRERGTPFTGLLYAGLMLTPDGPKVVEFNCRFGDPETQVVLPLVSANVGELMAAVARGESLAGVPFPRLHDRAAVGTVVAAANYPETPRTGMPITLPRDADDRLVFHAGTARDASGTLVVSGGRVATVVGLGRTFADAKARSASAAAEVRFEGAFFRPDIGWREADRSPHRD
jgi:phosphoribosylamine--glycine ligase